MTQIEKLKSDWASTLITMGIIVLIGLMYGSFSYLTTPKTTELTDCILSDLEDGAWSIENTFYSDIYYQNKSRGLRIDELTYAYDITGGLMTTDSLKVELTQDEMLYIKEAIKKHIEASSREQFIKNCK